MLTEPGPSSQSNSVAIAKVAALQSLNRSVTKATHKSCTCRKCSVGSCQGKKEVKYCLNMCQDCGLKNCKRSLKNLVGKVGIIDVR